MRQNVVLRELRVASRHPRERRRGPRPDDLLLVLVLEDDDDDVLECGHGHDCVRCRA